MEKEMPEVLEEYLCHISEVTVTNIDWIEEVINLRNLVDYLWEHQEWGEMECKDCEGTGEKWNCNDAWACPTCKGEGKIIHKALQYLREVKG
jgi:RecJ-like exonuclease